MYQHLKSLKVVILVITSLILSVAPLAGQSLWLKHNHKPMVSLEIYKIKYGWPSYYDFDAKLLNTTNFLSAYIPASPNLSVVFEVPLNRIVFPETRSSITFPPPYSKGRLSAIRVTPI